MKRRKPLMRKTPLRRVSPKRALVNALRATFVDEQLHRRPLCEAGKIIGRSLTSLPLTYMLCMGTSSEIHEPLTRARAPGADTILDPANSVAICRTCHSWIHSHPDHAEKLGLLKSSRGKS